MADETLDPAQAELAALYARFDAMEKHELVAIAVQLAQTYVVEGLGTLAASTAEAAPARGADQVGEETFAGMLRRLKQARPGDEVLQKFIVNGEHIQVRTPMGNVDVTEYRRPNAPNAPTPRAVGPAAARAAPSVPTNRDSIYNRELYQQNNQAPAGGGAPPAAPAAQPAAPAASRPPAPNSAPAAQNARPAAPAAKPVDKAEDDKKSGQRIRMIELD
jgi:hypothetical protein